MSGSSPFFVSPQNGIRERVTEGNRSGVRKFSGCALDIAVSREGKIWAGGCDSGIYT